MFVKFITNARKDVTMMLDDIESGERRVFVFTEDVEIKQATYVTADKKMIETIIRTKQYQSGQIYADVPEEAIVAYLEDETITDRFTKDELSEVTEEGLMKLRALYNISSPIPGIVRVQLVGKEISTTAREILSTHKAVKEIEKEAPDDVVRLLSELVEAKVMTVANRDYFHKGVKIGKRKEVLVWLNENRHILEKDLTPA